MGKNAEGKGKADSNLDKILERYKTVEEVNEVNEEIDNNDEMGEEEETVGNEEMEGEVENEDEEVNDDKNENKEDEEKLVQDGEEEKQETHPNLDKTVSQSSEVDSGLTRLKSQIHSQQAGNIPEREEQPGGWQSVDSLPAGWKYREVFRGSQKMSYILSPTGKIFPCRRLALKHMIEQDMPASQPGTFWRSTHPTVRRTLVSWKPCWKMIPTREGLNIISFLTMEY